jgi:hypothetical protein
MNAPSSHLIGAIYGAIISVLAGEQIMNIGSYSFGRIAIDGKTYTSDVILYPGRVDASWWRKEGHLLQLEDLAEVLRTKPEILIIGTGFAGVMRVHAETVTEITGRGIEMIVERTSKAVKIYNELQGTKTVIAALHITC